MISRPLRLPQKTNPLAFFHCFESSKYNFFVGAQKIVPAILRVIVVTNVGVVLANQSIARTLMNSRACPEVVTTLYEDGGLSNSFLGDGESY